MQESVKGVTQKMPIKPVSYVLFAVLPRLQCHSWSLRFLYYWLTFHAVEHDCREDITESYRQQGEVVVTH